MGLFNRFKKKTPEPAPEWPKPPKEDTMAILLMDRVLDSIDPAIALLQRAFGDSAVSDIDHSHPLVPAFTVKVDGLEFWCSYLPMPVPQEEQDIAAKAQYNLFLSPEEQEAFCHHKSFWVLAQKGGGASLEEKRRVCRLFTRLAGALTQLDGAVCVFVPGAELLISRRVYLQHAAILEKNWEDPEYFPAPLWIAIRSGQKGEASLVGTWGLRQFGFLELWFLDAKSPWPELHEKLYLMSIFQITGRELYQNMDTIAFTPGNPSTFKELNGALFIVGGGV